VSDESALSIKSERTREGLLAALVSYSLWGVLPIYFKVVGAVPATEVLVHRVLWAVPFGLPIVLLRRQWPDVVRALRTPGMLGLLSAAAVLIAINWLTYIWAVQNERVFQASLGYYINPLMYVLVGVAAFGDRLSRWQAGAVWLAAAGVAVLTLSGGESIRSRVAIGGMPGLFVETLVLLPGAVVYLGWLASEGRAVFLSGDLSVAGLLMLAGPFTVLPLLCFALAARRLTLSAIGILQFIAPTLQFLVGLAYGERLTGAHMVCFALIWIAVSLFSWDAWRLARSTAGLADP
jgi:chloramphenicol-sensitive protein RarD